MKGSVLSLLLVVITVHHVISEDRVWTIAMGDDWGAHEYRDEAGFLAGFGPDFMDAVCLEGRMDCRLVWAPYPFCFQSNKGTLNSGGRALLDRWMDGCSSWVVTVERIHIFSFTQTWIKNRPSYLYVRRGDNIDINNLNGKKIGFLNGWSTSELCFARVVKPLNDDQIIHSDTTDDILKLLLDRTIDAVFNTEYGWTADQLRQLQRVNSVLYCSLDGTGMMVRKDNALRATFNVAFNKLKNSGKFRKFCKAANDAHSSKGNILECTD